jgi:hypothetical protein
MGENKMHANIIFNPVILAQLESYCQQSKKAAMLIPLFTLSMIGNGLVVVLVMLFEYEILYRIFDYLAGDDSEYWSPSIMGCSAFILVIAIHYLAEQNKDNPSFVFINKAAGRLTIIYLFGIGLLLSLLLYLTGGDIFNGQILQPYGSDGTGSNWMDSVMSTFTMPVAGLLFSIGVGGLAIVSAFTAHSAMSKVNVALNEITVRRHNLMLDTQDLAEYHGAERLYDEIAQAKQTHTVKDDMALIDEVAADTLVTITDALAPSLITLNNHLMQHQAPDAQPRSALNIEQLQKAIEPIQAITTQTLLDAMSTTET